MTVLDALLKRRSVRTYKAQDIPNELLEKVAAAGLASESGRGKRPWELVLVNDRETLNALAETRESGSAKMLEHASAAILVFGLPEESDTWVEDCAIVMANMHLAADDMGLGSCWIQARNRMANESTTTSNAVREILQVPEGFELLAMLSLGYPEMHAQARGLYDLPYEKLHWSK